MSTPYTHEAHYARCVDAARLGQVPPMPLVQIMRRGVHYCGQLVTTWTTPSGLDCWTVDVIHPERARYTVPCKQVRLCGDARCICLDGRGAEGAPLAGEGPRGGLEGVTC